MCNKLLEHGAIVNAQTTNGRTVLHLAAVVGSWNVCEELLSHDANIGITINDGETLLEYARKAAEREGQGLWSNKDSIMHCIHRIERHTAKKALDQA